MDINSIQGSPIYAVTSSVPAISDAAAAEPQGDFSPAAIPIPSPLFSSPQSDAPPLEGIVAGVDFLKQKLDELLTSYPPFFPAGSPQRVDLIKKVKGLEEEVQKSSLDDNLKRMFTGHLSEDAGDQAISLVLDKLFHVRDTLVAQERVETEAIQPGTLMNITM